MEKVQRRKGAKCKGAKCKGATLQRWKGATVQRCQGQRCKGVKGKGAKVKRCQGAGKVQSWQVKNKVTRKHASKQAEWHRHLLSCLSQLKSNADLSSKYRSQNMEALTCCKWNCCQVITMVVKSEMMIYWPCGHLCSLSSMAVEKLQGRMILVACKDNNCSLPLYIIAVGSL